jgi:multidrug resistance efflux pump
VTEEDRDQGIDRTLKQNAPAANTDPVGRATYIATVACVFLAFWYIVGDRVTPSTSQARVQSYTVPIVSQVAGLITRVDVAVNQLVEANQTLIHIDPDVYALAVSQAEIDLALAGQNVGADTANVASAQANLTNAQAELARVERDMQRVIPLEARGILPKADADRARGIFEQSQARVEAAKAELLGAQTQLGKEGDSLRIRAAIAALERAQIDLERTTIHAPSDGGVTNVRAEVGQYATRGQPLMTFISKRDVWIEAFLRENSIGNIKPGDPVEIVLDVAPGQVFDGEVRSVGFAISWDKSAPGGLAIASRPSGWLRDPQRFPVVIKFSDESAYGLRRGGGQADIIVYTGEGWVMNGLGWLSIRITALLSYLY